MRIGGGNLVGAATVIEDGVVDVADLANGTDGEVITWDAAGVAATVSVGNAGEILTSNGAGAAPTFQAAAGGGALSLIDTISESSTTNTASVTIAEERQYLCVWYGRGVSGSADCEWGVRINGDTGTNYSTYTYRVSGGAITQYSNNNAMKFGAGRRNGAESRGFFWINTHANPTATSNNCRIYGTTIGNHFHNPGDEGLGTVGGSYTVSSPTITSFNVARIGGTGAFAMDMFVYELDLT